MGRIHLTGYIRANMLTHACAGQAYVALSRATSLDGLQVLNFDPAKVRVPRRLCATPSFDFVHDRIGQSASKGRRVDQEPRDDPDSRVRHAWPRDSWCAREIESIPALECLHYTLLHYTLLHTPLHYTIHHYTIHHYTTLSAKGALPFRERVYVVYK